MADANAEQQPNEGEGDSWKVKVFGRRRTQEISLLKGAPKFQPTVVHNPIIASVFVLMIVGVSSFAVYSLISGNSDPPVVDDGIGKEPLTFSNPEYFEMIKQGALLGCGIGLLIFFAFLVFPSAMITACVVLGPQILIALGIYLLAKHYDGGSSGSEIFPSSSPNGVDQRNKNRIQSVAYMYGAIGLIVYGLVVLIWSFVLWSAIRRTKNLVSHSMKILWSNIASGFTLVGLAILCFCQQFAWLAVVLITLAKLEVKGWALIIALPALSFWGLFTFGNVFYITCAGVVARSYFGYPVSACEAYYHANVYSLGPASACALLRTTIQVLRWVVDYATSAAQDKDTALPALVCLCVLRCFLFCIIDLMDFLAQIFSKYSMALCGIYNLSVENAGYEACSLIFDNGLQILTNENVTEMIGVFAGLGGFFASVVCAQVFLPEGDPDSMLWSRMLAGFSCFAVVYLMISIIDAMVTALLTCYAEDPEPMVRLSLELKEEFEAKKALAAQEPKQLSYV